MCFRVPVSFHKELEGLEIKENDCAVFEAEVSSPHIHGLWLKDGEVIQADSRVQMRAEGTKHRLIIMGTQFCDDGLYTLKLNDAETSAILKVLGITVHIIMYNAIVLIVFHTTYYMLIL